MTNAEKFKEIFGYDIDIDAMTICPFKNVETACLDRDVPCRECLDDYWYNKEYQGKPTKTDLISKEEALELFPLILSGELLTIATVREQLRELQTVEAVSLSVIEDIRAEIDTEYKRFRNKSDKWDERASGIGTALEIIDRKIKEIKNERS